MIELGCGSTGIPGLVSLASGASHVLFCDHDSHAISELNANIESNMSVIFHSRESLGINSSPMYSFHNGDWCSLSIPSTPPLLLASEIVYDAILILPLIECIDQLIAKCGSLLFCQSRSGRGNLDEFFRILTMEPYCFQFESIPILAEERDPLDDFIFGIFHK